MRLIPLIDDLAIQAVDGALLRRSRPALFQGLGRRPLAGDRWRPLSGGNADPAGSDPYVSFPPEQCLLAGCANRVAPEYEFLSSDPDLGDFVKQDPNSTNLRKPLLGADGKPISDCALGPVLRVQRRRHDGHRARRRPVVLPAGADPGRQRAAAVRDAPIAAGPLPPRGRRRVSPASARRAAGRQRAARVLRPAAPSAAQAPTPADRSPSSRSCRSLPSSRSASRSASSPPLRCRSPAPCCGRARRAAASGGRSRSSARRRSRPRRCRPRPGSTTRTRASRPDTCWARSCSRPWPGTTIFGGPRPRTRVQPAPAYARQARHTRRPL